MMTASFKHYILNFKAPSGTSRGVLKTKHTWFIILEANGVKGIGECGMFAGLSVDDRPDYQDKLEWTCDHIHLGLEHLLLKLIEFPSIQIGLEMAFKSLESHDSFNLYPSKFSLEEAPIAINGLIWMGSKSFMRQQIKDKLNAGFSCIKMKIGAIDFSSEMELLKSIRQEFSASDIELRVDANGAFSPHEALEKLKRLSQFNLHSIEQPIRQGQWNEMARLCEYTPLPIALDEELIGVFSEEKKVELLTVIKPQYIILKPTLVGGFGGSESWIKAAEQAQIKWWITSALESNIGLSAIAQWTYTLGSELPQGLGTGSLYTNNFDSPLVVKNGTLQYENNRVWDLSHLDVII